MYQADLPQYLPARASSQSHEVLRQGEKRVADEMAVLAFPLRVNTTSTWTLQRWSFVDNNFGVLWSAVWLMLMRLWTLRDEVSCITP
jgi:hypothetical protein